ncbi:MAG: hypothetical protein ABFS02_05725 [Pseudomonadota bacterium]
MLFFPHAMASLNAQELHGLFVENSRSTPINAACLCDANEMSSALGLREPDDSASLSAIIGAGHAGRYCGLLIVGEKYGQKKTPPEGGVWLGATLKFQIAGF